MNAYGSPPIMAHYTQGIYTTDRDKRNPHTLDAPETVR